MSTPSVATLREFLDLDAADARTLKAALVDADGGGAKRVDAALNLADTLMRAHGVEAIRGSDWDNYYGDAVALYVNTGDAYSGTLLYDIDKGRFYATTYGDWVEREERAGRHIPNRHTPNKERTYVVRWEEASGKGVTIMELPASDKASAMKMASEISKQPKVSRVIVFSPQGKIVHQEGAFAANPCASDKVLGTIGDVNPIEHGGGIVFDTQYGPEIEYTHGFEPEHGYDEDDEGATRLTIYRVPVGDNALKDLNWVKPDDLRSIAISMDTSVPELRRQAKSDDVMDRVRFYEDVAGYWGWRSLDSEPYPITADELSERWYGKKYNANEAEKFVSMNYGTMPTKKQFDKAFEREVPSGGYEIRLSRSDSRATDGTIIGDDTYDSDELYKGVKQLVKKWEKGSEPAGDLASSILYMLGFEWI